MLKTEIISCIGCSTVSRPGQNGLSPIPRFEIFIEAGKIWFCELPPEKVLGTALIGWVNKFDQALNASIDIYFLVQGSRRISNQRVKIETDDVSFHRI